MLSAIFFLSLLFHPSYSPHVQYYCRLYIPEYPRAESSAAIVDPIQGQKNLNANTE